MRILHVCHADGELGGGAGKIAQDLMQRQRAGGHEAWLAVSAKGCTDDAVLPIPQRTNPWSKFWLRAQKRLRARSWRLSRAAWMLAEPGRWWDAGRGHEDFRYPATWRLLEVPPQRPQVLHCHNLHGGYFDLRALPWLSGQLPVVVTLEDAWTLAGHCAHSLDCERWKTGCGSCPHLSIPCELEHDGTAFNWQRKRGIYARSRLHIATPCEWLMRKVKESILAPGMVEGRVINNGIDLDTFHPADKRAVRSELGIPQDEHVLLFIAVFGRNNPWKDYQTVRDAVAILGSQPRRRKLRFLSFGETAPTETVGHATVQFIPRQPASRDVARYYQAADLYVHAARADTFPNTIMEASACGTAILATAVCGIPEQIAGWNALSSFSPEWNRTDAATATGGLVPASNAVELARAASRLLEDDAALRQLSENAVRLARERFDIQRQARRYLEWYAELVRQ
jgi:glycosyltransferase involved in cell wall biosynthesis